MIFKDVKKITEKNTKIVIIKINFESTLLIFTILRHAENLFFKKITQFFDYRHSCFSTKNKQLLQCEELKQPNFTEYFAQYTP